MRILAISKRTFIELWRDKRSLALLFAAPILIMWLMNAAFSASTDVSVDIATVNVSATVTKALGDIMHIIT